MLKIYIFKVIKTLVYSLSCPKKALSKAKLENDREYRAKKIVASLSFGNVSLQSGRYITQEDLSLERLKIKSR